MHLKKLNIQQNQQMLKVELKNLKFYLKDLITKNYQYLKKLHLTEGVNANLVATSNNIGKIEKVRVLDIGYEYSADKTLQPEVFIPSILNVDNLDTVTSIDIVNGGSDYTTSPNLILFNPVSNEIVDTGSLSADVPNQTIFKC